jgi:hypothetical protein
MVRPFPSFAMWAQDHGVERRVEAAAQKLTTSGPVYRRITKAAYCLADLGSSDFPASLQEDLSVLRSVSKYIGHFPDGRTGSAIPHSCPSGCSLSCASATTCSLPKGGTTEMRAGPRTGISNSFSASRSSPPRPGRPLLRF